MGRFVVVYQLYGGLVYNLLSASVSSFLCDTGNCDLSMFDVILMFTDLLFSLS